jgi:hypothetical protein
VQLLADALQVLPLELGQRLDQQRGHWHHHVEELTPSLQLLCHGRHVLLMLRLLVVRHRLGGASGQDLVPLLHRVPQRREPAQHLA